MVLSMLTNNFLTIFSRNSRKAQSWTMDFLIAVIIFSIFLLVFRAVSSASIEHTYTQKVIEAGAIRISESLLTQGSPPNWTRDSYNAIGLLGSDGQLDERKLNETLHLPMEDIRKEFSQPSYFYFYVEDMNGVVVKVDGTEFKIGDEPTNYNNLISVQRIVGYKGDPVKLVVQTWS